MVLIVRVPKILEQTVLQVMGWIQEQCIVEFSRVVDHPVLMQLQFQQSFPHVLTKVPKIQFAVRLRELPVVPERPVLTVQTVQKNCGGSTVQSCDHAETSEVPLDRVP